MKPFRERDRKGVEYPKYRGWVQIGPRARDRKKVVLFTDRRVSERHLAKLQSEADAMIQDPELTRRRAHGKQPIAEHAKDYVEFIKRTTKNKDYPRIVECMLTKLIALASWNYLDDMTAASLESVVKQLASAAKPATVEYCNGFIKRAKAFASWCIPDRLLRNPFQKVKRGSVIRGLRRRARRAALAGEVDGLMAASPVQYRLKWAFPMLTGFRRSEMASLTVDDLRLNAPIPFIQLRSEWTKNEHADALPLHPALVVPLTELIRDAAPGDRVFDSIPDVKTLKKYFELGGGQFEIAGRRFDFHALRHTFKTDLDAVGCSESTKKSLLRHAVPDVSGGYSHPRLAELAAAICKLRSPFPVEHVAIRTGTDDASSSRTYAGQTACISSQAGAFSCTMSQTSSGAGSSGFVSMKSSDCASVHACALPHLINAANADIVPKTGPSTQVD